MLLENLSEDCILNGKLKFFQPKNGYRIPIDPIILASMIKISKNQMVLDVGCGVGTISLILKFKNPSAEISAIDIDPKICEICKLNSEKNSLPLNVYNLNLTKINESILKNMRFDHVVTNPPYFTLCSSRISEATRFAKFETMPLNNWIEACLKKLNDQGTFSIIHDAARIDDIIFTLKNSRVKVGNFEIFPIYSKKNSAAKRVIVKCRKNGKSVSKILHPIITHNDDGTYSSEMADILSGNFLYDHP